MILDFVFAIILAFLLFWGYSNGVVGTGIWFLAVFLSVTIGTQTVGRVVPEIGLPAPGQAALASIGYVLVSAATFFIAKLVSSTLNQAVSLTPLKWINVLGGALAGLAIGIVVVAAVIAGLAVFAYLDLQFEREFFEAAAQYTEVADLADRAEYYLFQRPREWLDEQMRQSIAVQAALTLRPLLVPFAPADVGDAVDILDERPRLS